MFQLVSERVHYYWINFLNAILDSLFYLVSNSERIMAIGKSVCASFKNLLMFGRL
jgi:hypothetical protein